MPVADSGQGAIWQFPLPVICWHYRARHAPPFSFWICHSTLPSLSAFIYVSIFAHWYRQDLVRWNTKL